MKPLIALLIAATLSAGVSCQPGKKQTAGKPAAQDRAKAGAVEDTIVAIQPDEHAAQPATPPFVGNPAKDVPTYLAQCRKSVENAIKTGQSKADIEAMGIQLLNKVKAAYQDQAAFRQFEDSIKSPKAQKQIQEIVKLQSKLPKR